MPGVVREGTAKAALTTFSAEIRFWYHFEAGFALDLYVPTQIGIIGYKSPNYFVENFTVHMFVPPFYQRYNKH